MRTDTYGHRCADRALKYIDAHGDADFFLTVSFDEPHDPSLCPEPYASMYREYLWPESDARATTRWRASLNIKSCGAHRRAAPAAA